MWLFYGDILGIKKISQTFDELKIEINKDIQFLNSINMAFKKMIKNLILNKS